MYGIFQSQVLMSHLFSDITVQRMNKKDKNVKGANHKSNQHIKRITHGKKKCEQKYVFNLQPDNLQAFAHPLQ